MAVAASRFLLVTNEKDVTSDFLVRELRSRGLDFGRFNTETLAECSVARSSSGAGFTVYGPNIRFDTGKVSSAYFRRPGIVKVGGDQSPDALAYRRSEWVYLLRALYLSIGDRWFSHPNAILLAENKPGQLELANAVGFDVPDYVVTNDYAELVELFEDGPVIAKPLTHNLLDETPKQSVLFTSNVLDLNDVDPDRLRLAPVIFQRKIEKAYDIRVTVIGTSVFAVRINSQAHEHTRTDWRISGDELLDHRLFELASDVSEKCVQLVKRLGLRYGAIDLVEDQNGTFWFLECNPNGQWAWIEHMTGAPISRTIVDELVSMSGGTF